jgi:hypothetical protein
VTGPSSIVDDGPVVLSYGPRARATPFVRTNFQRRGQLLMRISRVCAAMLAVALAVGCGSDSVTDPGPQTVLGLAVTPKGATSVQLTFTGTAGDASYGIERATGAAGTFAAVGSVPAPANGGVVTRDDTGLMPNTVYR